MTKAGYSYIIQLCWILGGPCWWLGVYRDFQSNSLDIPELTYLCCALKFIPNYSALGEDL